MLGAAGGGHCEVAVGKALGSVFIDGIERIYQAVAERISIDVERRMDEVRDVHPEILIARPDVDRSTQALILHAKPDLADPLGGQFAVAPFGVNGALE